MAPLFSLLLIVKNGMPYLPQAMQSVAAQTYRDFELIVQDGASTDGTLEFLEKLEGIPNVDIVSAPDSGLGEAYNRAVARSHGEIIGTIDDDNLLQPDTLEIVGSLFVKHPEAAAIYGAVNTIDDCGRVVQIFRPGPFDVLRLMRCELVPPFCASFFSRRICGDTLRFDNRRNVVQDFDLWLRLSHLPIIMVPRIIASTRNSGLNMTSLPSFYDRFCEGKISALKNHLVRSEDDTLPLAVWRQCSAGVYCWAAESVLDFDGPSEQVRRYVQLASELDPFYQRIEDLRAKMAVGTRSQIIQKENSQPPPVIEWAVAGGPPSPAAACWNQRMAVASTSGRLRELRAALDDLPNLSPPQWTHWFAYAREYRPDLILELGRHKGSATAVSAQALHENQHGRLVSLCATDTWKESSEKLLRRLVEPDWFDRLEIRTEDICHADFRSIVGDASRVLVLWDAPGFAVAEAVLGRLLPILQDRQHMVIMHDISDRRYCGGGLAYGEAALWQGMEWVERNGFYDSRVYVGWISTAVDQAIAVLDFLTRNRSELQSADHSFHQEIGADPARCQEMRFRLPPEEWSMVGHWAYFSLNTVPKPYTFPKTTEQPDPKPAEAA